MFNENLKALRIKSGLTQESLGESLGLTKQIICAYEAGTRTPSQATLIAIANVFDCTTDYLLGRKTG